ncbi:MAG: signal peptidase I [Bacteroidia bacterium]|nr:signal peptidase I [Bacteroidia bacterium]
MNLLNKSSIELWDISEDVLKSGNAVRVTLKGTSMYPYLKIGDIALVNGIQAKDSMTGDIIVFRFGKNYLAHRLIKKGESYLLTKGDSCRVFDQPVPVKDLIGKITRLERKGNIINMESKSRKLMNLVLAKFLIFQRINYAFHYYILRDFLSS